jgi:hypothetical protein
MLQRCGSEQQQGGYYASQAKRGKKIAPKIGCEPPPDDRFHPKSAIRNPQLLDSRVEMRNFAAPFPC